MYKTEFCLNNHTNGRNTNLNKKQNQEWKLVGSAFGSLNVNFSSYAEFSIEVWIANDTRYMHKFHLTSKEISERLYQVDYFNIFSGCYSGAPESVNTQSVALRVAMNYFSIPLAMSGSTDKTSNSTLYVYAR